MNTKHLRNLFVFLFVSAVAISCGDKDDPQPVKLEDVKLGVFETEITVPEGLTASTDEHAQAVNDFISQISLTSSYSAYFEVPEGATKLSSPVVGANGRLNGNIVTYEWAYQGGAIAYQITELDEAYLFELFFKTDDSPYYKWFEGEQAKDGKSGSIVMFNYTDDTVVFQYDYEYRSDGSFFLQYDLYGMYSLQMLVNADKSGYIKSFSSDVISFEYNWDAAGNGNWIQYDESGTQVSTGSWTAGS